MGLLSKLVMLPARGPFDGVAWLSRQIADAAEAELNDPNRLRAALAEAETRLLAGEISEETYDQIEEVILDRLRSHP